MTHLVMELEGRLLDEFGVPFVVEEGDDGTIGVTGTVTSEEDRVAALALAGEEFPDRRIADGITVEPAGPGELVDVLSATTQIPEAEAAEALGEDSLEAGDFTDERVTAYGPGASGPSSALDEDIASGGEVVFSPPNDPVGTDDEVIGGLQADSMESIEVDRSALDGRPGDAALEDAILRELREDAATTDLEITVTVEGGVARLRGRVPYLIDAENAEEVAARVPGVVEVLEELDVIALE